MRKYTYSRTLVTVHGQEVFTAVEFDSFDEAQRVVDKGIHDRKLELEKEMPLGLRATSEVVHNGSDVGDTGNTAGNVAADLRGAAPGPEVLDK